MKKVSFFAFALIFAGAVACNNPQAEEATDATEEVADTTAMEATEVEATETMEEVADTTTMEAMEGEATEMEGEAEEAMTEDHSEHSAM